MPMKTLLACVAFAVTWIGAGLLVFVLGVSR